MARNDSSRKRKKRSKMSGPSVGLIIIALGTVAGFCIIGCVGLTILGVPAARQAARQTQSKNGLKQIGLALHNYHETYNMFPPGDVVREDGVSLGSWQARLLPYVDAAPLYQQIDFNEGWESAQNSHAYQQVVPAYRNPGVMTQPDPSTSYYAGNVHMFPAHYGMSFQQVHDGASNTIAVGEVTHGFKRWGDPTNLRDPADGIGPTPTQFNGCWGKPGCQFLFVDGSAKFIDSDIDPTVLQALATPAGGEPLGDF
ncbi:MAG: DUF1559 domain-containing protein [Planctomycetaceae bacterium]|nr:DUF1559 domain-containing protein [Planctomycetaceae bacterium]